MGRKLFKNMYLRGTINSFADFPKLEDRREGMMWQFTNTGTIGDPETATRVDATAFTTEDGNIKTLVGHDIVGDANYCVVESTADVVFAAEDLGKILLVIDSNDVFIERYITEIVTTTQIKVATPFVELFPSGVDASDIDKVSILGKASIYVDPATHEFPINPAYGIITGTDTLFTTELAIGDVIEATINSKLQRREVKAINSATELVLMNAFDVNTSGGDISGVSYTIVNNDELIVTTGTIGIDVSAHMVSANSDYCKVTITASHGLIEGDKISYFCGTSIHNRTVVSIVGGTAIYIDRPYTVNQPLTAVKKPFIAYDSTAYTTATPSNFYIWMDNAFVLV